MSKNKIDKKLIRWLGLNYFKLDGFVITAYLAIFFSFCGLLITHNIGYGYFFAGLGMGLFSSYFNTVFVATLFYLINLGKVNFESSLRPINLFYFCLSPLFGLIYFRHLQKF